MSEKDNEQQNTNTEIGDKLRKARQAKGYTLDDLQQITKIQKRYLIAIEDEKFDELPGDFYVRAFVKQYADTVGLDGDELLKEYDDDLPKTKTSEYSDHIAQAVETRASQRKTISNGVDKSKRYLPTIIIACVIILVLAAIWVTAIARSHRDSSTRIDNSSVSVSGESRKKSSSKKTSQQASGNKSANTIKLKQTTRNDTSVTYSADKLSADTNLQINPTQRAWMQVRANNNSDLLNKTLNANQKTTVKVSKDTTSLVITVGNAKATTLKIGNQKIDFTDNGRYQNTKTVTINFGSQSNSSSSSSSSSTSSNSSSNTTSSSSRVSSSSQSTSTTSQSSSSTTNGQQTATSNATSRQQTTQTR